ncbi:MAG: M56 family metallopeptidase [Candidatus Aminicenantaceae bacterium]
MPAPHNVYVAEWLLNSALQCMVILLVGRLFLYLFRHRGAPLRSAISLVTMLVLITLPFLSQSMDDGGFLPFHASLPVTIGISGGSMSTSIEITTEIPAEGVQQGAAAGHSIFSIPYLAAYFSGPILIKVINLLGLIWGLGCIALGLRFVFGLLTVRGMQRGSTPVDDPRIPAILVSAEKSFGGHIRTKILESPQIDSPMAVGFFRPIILLPDGLLAGLRDPDVRSILFHELSHIFHWDQITGIIQRLMTGLLWWNPLAYGLSRGFTRAREEISDTHVLLENDSEEYAECLINLAENASSIRRLPVVIAMASPHIPLKDRVQIILSKERTMETQLNKPVMLVIAFIAFLLVGGIAGTRLTFAEPEEATTTETLTFQPIPDLDMSGIQEKQKKNPRQTKIVQPKYPLEAKEKGIEGTVAVEAVIDTNGRITEARVIHSAGDLLDKVSLDAVRQWTYEPMEINGTPVRSMMTVVCRFNLDENHPPVSVMAAVGEDEKEKPPIRALGDIKPPKVIRLIQPIYPDEARKAGIQGVVILEAKTDIYGRVKEVKVLRSIPALDQAAIEAVKQWVYEPMIVNKEPREVIFTTTVRFQLDKNKDKTSGSTGGIEGGVAGGVEGKTTGGVVGGVEGGVSGGIEGGVATGGSSKPPLRIEHDIKPPKQLKTVSPIYPKEAKKAGIEGVVILEVTTDVFGRVREVKVLRSIPELDQAAIDAVKQWVYEPMLIDGEPRETIFTVTCRFKKDE